jgi:hypothetical protein
MSKQREEDRERVQLSFAQAAASVLATVSAAVLCSFFGVAGTIIGTAVTSLVATIGGALYSYSLRRTQARLRRLHQAGAASPPLREVLKTARQQGRRLLGSVPWGPIVIGSLTVFVFSIGVVTAIEAEQGETLSALFGVSHASHSKCSLCAVADTKKRKPKPSHSPSPPTSPTPSPSSTPSVTPPPVTPTPSLSPSPTPSEARTCGVLGLLPCPSATATTPTG